MPFNRESVESAGVAFSPQPGHAVDRPEFFGSPLQAPKADDSFGRDVNAYYANMTQLAGYSGEGGGVRCSEESGHLDRVSNPSSPLNAADSDRWVYCLARVDDETGLPLRRATQEEAEELGRILALSGSNKHLFSGVGAGDGFAAGVDRRMGSTGPKNGGPCNHCGATESPQWRRGPPVKPVLCNACGTRYRRTGQLGPPGPQGMRGKSSRTMDKRRWDRSEEGESRTPLVFCEAA